MLAAIASLCTVTNSKFSTQLQILFYSFLSFMSRISAFIHEMCGKCEMLCYKQKLR
jgi:hypothetical protein